MNHPLAQLHDIEEISQVSWWPLAWGWWVLLLLTLCSLVLLTGWLYRKRKHERRLKLCMQNIRSADKVAEISTELKIAVLHYMPEFSSEGQAYAAVSGFELLQQLNSQLPKAKQHKEANLKEIATQLYRPSAHEVVENYRSFALQWLSHACPRRPRHV